MKEILVKYNDEYGTHWYHEELIQCKDCKYWKLERYVGGEGMACQFMPSDGNVNLTKPTDYCCWAERKE